MLSHENVMANVSAVCLQLGEYRPNKTDVLISFLPLAHMFEHNCQVRVFMFPKTIFKCNKICFKNFLSDSNVYVSQL